MDDPVVRPYSSADVDVFDACGNVRIRASRRRLDRRHQLLDRDRLHDVVVHPGGEARSRSPCIALAVIATIRGRSSAAQRSRIRRVASSPSISGIWTSISTRSYGCRSSASIASIAVAGDVRAVAELLEQPERELLVHGVVLGQQDPQRVSRAELRIVRARRGFLRASSRPRRAPVARARCSGEALIGLVTNASIPGVAHRGAASSRARRPTRRAGRAIRAPVRASRAASSRPSVPGHHISTTARSNGPPPSAASASSRGAPRPRPSPRRGSALTIRRFVALSSTTSMRRPASDPRPAERGGRPSASPASNVRRNVLPSPAPCSRPRSCRPSARPAADDRQAQPRAPVAAGGRDVGLAERLEQPVDPVRRDPDARVADRHREPIFPAALAGVDDTLTTTSPCSVNLTALPAG